MKRNRKLKWPGLKHLTFEQSEKFQEIADEIAKEKNVSKVHLDIFIWLKARNMEKTELIQDIETAINQISEGKGVAHSKAHQMLKMQILPTDEIRRKI